jgi:hypothetical protein
MADTDPRLRRLRLVARCLDSAFGVPGTRWRFGLDPAIGVVPVIGDLVTLALAAWIVVEGWRLGADRRTLARMSLNIVIDAVIGSIPLIGDIADVFTRMNERNVELLERVLGGPPAS